MSIEQSVVSSRHFRCRRLAWDNLIAGECCILAKELTRDAGDALLFKSLVGDRC